MDRDTDGIGVINLATVGGAAGHRTLDQAERGIHRHCFHPACSLRGEARVSESLSALVLYLHLFY